MFNFTSEAGREANLFLGWADPDVALYAHFGVIAGMFTRGGTLALDGISTGRFPMADSTYTVIVDPHWAAQRHETRTIGSYAVRVVPIDRRPEERPASYSLGDTVAREVLHPAGDIDEYSFVLAEATTVDIFWDAPFGNLAEAIVGMLFPDGNRETPLEPLAGFDAVGYGPTRALLPRGSLLTDHSRGAAADR